MHRGGGTARRDGDHSIVSDEDLEKISAYFWNAINTPRGLIQKVWFDLMLHLGADGKYELTFNHSAIIDLNITYN